VVQDGACVAWKGGAWAEPATESAACTRATVGTISYSFTVVYKIMISRFFSNKETAQLQKADMLGVFPHVEVAVI
jgi:hypothetical protein